MKNINQYLKNNNLKFNKDYEIGKLTTIGLGGKADYVVYPLNLTELINLIKFCRKNKIKFEILGNGSNVLYSDKRYKGVIICVNYISKVRYKNNKLYAFCGARLPYLSYFAMLNEIKGYETLSLIPGSVGASICINAGAYGKTIGDNVIFVVTINQNNKIKIYKKDELKFSYRSSNIKENNEIVLFACLEVQKGKKEEIKSLMDLYAKKRYESQPLYERNFGSIFKNPPNNKVYEIIKLANVEDFSYKGVKLSKKHLNFLQLSTNNCAKDVLYFIEKLRQKVYNKVGLLLDNEVILVNWRRKYVKRVKRIYK